MKEAELMRAIQLAYSHGPVRLLRNNCGVLQDAHGSYIKFGLAVGSSDLIGWRTHVIQPRDVGNEVAIFTALECKGPHGHSTPEQLAFISTVQEAGGIAGIVRSVEEANKLLKY